MSDPILEAQARRLKARLQVRREWENLDHLRLARSYGEYVEDKKKRGEKPLGKAEWESLKSPSEDKSKGKGLKTGPKPSRVKALLSKANGVMSKAWTGASKSVHTFMSDPVQRKQMAKAMRASVNKNAPKAAKAMWNGFTGEMKAIFVDTPHILAAAAGAVDSVKVSRIDKKGVRKEVWISGTLLEKDADGNYKDSGTVKLKGKDEDGKSRETEKFEIIKGSDGKVQTQRKARTPTKSELHTLYGVGVYAAGTALAFSGASPLLAAGKAFGHSITLHATFKAISNIADEIFLGVEAVESGGMAGGLSAAFGTGDIPGLNHIWDFVANVGSAVTKLGAEGGAGPEGEEEKFLHDLMQKIYAEVGKVFEGLTDEDMELVMAHGVGAGGGGSKAAKTFTLEKGDPLFTGKYLNSPGRIEEFGENDKGDPTVVVRKRPKGDKGQGAKKEVKLFKVRFDEEQAEQDKAEKTADMSDRASRALMKMLSEIARRAGAAEHIYVVGGAVRNFVIDQPIKDIDVVIDSIAAGRDSEWFANLVAKAIPAKTSVMTDQYGVSKVFVLSPWELAGDDLMDPAQAAVEIANARKESYGGAAGKGYKPDNVEPTTIEQDVKRREFTFNTLMWSLLELAKGPDKAEILDLTGCGLQDLKDRRMQCPSDPDTTFSDDPSRMLRAVKFIIKYGMKLTPDTEASIKRNLRKLRNAPMNKIAEILEDTLMKDWSTAKKALPEMKRLGLLGVVADWIREDKAFRSRMEKWVTRKPMLMMYDLMDLGLPLGASVGFLDRDQQVRLRQMALGMPEGEPEKFLAVLKQPGKAMDTRALIQEFGLQGRAISEMQKGLGVRLLLEDPNLAADTRKFTEAVRRNLKRGIKTGGEYTEFLRDQAKKRKPKAASGDLNEMLREKARREKKDAGSPLVQLNIEMPEGEANVEKVIPSGSLPYLIDDVQVRRVAAAYIRRKAGLFEAPPAMLETVSSWMVTAYAGHALGYVEEKLAAAGGGWQANAEKALASMVESRRSFQRNLGRMSRPGEILKIPVAALRFDNTLETAIMGVKAIDPGAWGTEEKLLYDKAVSSKRLTFKRRARGYKADSIIYWAESYLDTAISRLKGSIKSVAAKGDTADTSDLEALKAAAKKVNPKAKRYSTGTKRVFPVNTTGWKYIRPGSPVIDKINKAIEQTNAKIRAAVALGKEELKDAQAYYKTLRARKPDEKAQEQARQALDSRGYQLGRPNYTPWDVRKRAETGDKPTKAFAVVGPDTLPVDAVSYPSPFGPDEVDKALKLANWDKITCVLVFKAHKSRGGVWIGGKRELQVDVGDPWPRTVAEFETQVGEIRRICRHEMQHVGQDLLRVALQLREDAGLPGSSLSDSTYTPSGYRKDSPRYEERFRQDHALRGVEFYTRLSDEVERFMRATMKNRDQDWKAPAQTFVTNPRHPFFGPLKREQPAKWKKAVGEFYKAVQKRIEALPKREAAVARLRGRPKYAAMLDVVGSWGSPLVTRPAYGEVDRMAARVAARHMAAGLIQKAHKVKFGRLPDPVKADIVDNLTETHPALRGYDRYDVRDLIDENDTVLVGVAEVDAVHRQSQRTHRTSERAVAGLREKLLSHGPSFELDPVIVRGRKFIDGGHRTEAYFMADREWIPVLDISPLWEQPWAEWVRDSGFEKLAARYQNKKQVPKTDGKGTTTVYEYSEGQVEHRNREKAKRVEKLRGSIDKLRSDVTKDLKSKNETTRLVALAVGLMDHTYERVGNEGSAKDGHFGVTGWQKKHVSFSGSKATIKYVGKSGVNQTKTVTDKALVSALKASCKDVGDADCVTGSVSAGDVNKYLKAHDITAKDIRGYHANTEVQTRLKAIRAKGGKLPSDPKKKAKKLKDEFNKALEQAAEAVGHKSSTLKSQYLVPGMERNYLQSGKVVDNLAKQGSTERIAIISIYNAWPSEKGRPEWELEGFQGLISSLTGYEWALVNDMDREAGGQQHILTGPDGGFTWRGYPVEASAVTELQAAGYLGETEGGKIGLSHRLLGKRSLYRTARLKGALKRLLQRADEALAVFGWGQAEMAGAENDPADQYGGGALGYVWRVGQQWWSMAPEENKAVRRHSQHDAVSALRHVWRSATKSKAEKDDEEAERLTRPAPTKKPPRKDLRRERVKDEDDDKDTGRANAENDKDLSLNYKKVARRFHAEVLQELGDLDLMRLAKGKVDKDQPEKGPGDYWEAKGGWRAWPPKGDSSTNAESEEAAKAIAEGGGGGEDEEGGEDKPDPKEEKAKQREKHRNELRRQGEQFEKSFDAIANSLDEGMGMVLLEGFPDKDSKEFLAMAEAFADHLDVLAEVYIDDSRGLSKAALGDASEAFAMFQPPPEPEASEDEDADKPKDKDSEVKAEAARDAARKAKLKEFTGAGPEDRAKILARLHFAQRVVANPAVVGGRALAGRSDPDDLKERGSEAARQYNKASPEIRAEAAKQAAASLKEMAEDDPNRAEANAILDGLAIAAAANGESLEVDGEMVRPRMSKGHQVLCKHLIKGGKEDILLGSMNDFYGPAGRRAVGSALGTMEDKELAEFGKTGHFSNLAKKLTDKNVDESQKAFIRGFLKRQGVEDMTTSQALVEAVAAETGIKSAKVEQEWITHLGEHPENQAWQKKLEKAIETGGDGAEAAIDQEYQQWLSKLRLDWLKAMGLDLPPNHPEVARHTAIVETGETSLLDQSLVPQGSKTGSQTFWGQTSQSSFYTDELMSGGPCARAFPVGRSPRSPRRTESWH